MKHKISLLIVVLSFVASLALAQTTLINDATMSRLRLANLVFGSGATDMYVDGQIPLLGDIQRELTEVPAGAVSGFLYLEPGTYSVAVVPTGKGLEEAMIALEVTLEPGHRYTVGVMGQKEDARFTPLVIDETAAIAGVRTSPEQNIVILVNNQSGINTISFDEDGVGPKDAPYGGFVVAPIKVGHVDTLVVTAMTEEGEVTLPDFGYADFYELPGVDFILYNIGRYPGNYDVDNSLASSPFQSDLNPLELLKQISDFDIVWDGQEESFDTLLAALETTDLSDMLTTGTYLIFAPTDAAFEAMPKEQLDALMADPEALADFLRYHITQGNYPGGGLSGTVWGKFDSTVTNMQGVDLKLSDAGGFSVNGIDMPGLPSLFVANGTRIIPVTKVLLPPSQ